MYIDKIIVKHLCFSFNIGLNSAYFSQTHYDRNSGLVLFYSKLIGAVESGT